MQNVGVGALDDPTAIAILLFGTSRGRPLHCYIQIFLRICRGEHRLSVNNFPQSHNCINVRHSERPRQGESKNLRSFGAAKIPRLRSG